jgi:hypothetical protein
VAARISGDLSVRASFENAAWSSVPPTIAMAEAAWYKIRMRVCLCAREGGRQAGRRWARVSLLCGAGKHIRLPNQLAPAALSFRSFACSMCRQNVAFDARVRVLQPCLFAAQLILPRTLPFDPPGGWFLVKFCFTELVNI